MKNDPSSMYVCYRADVLIAPLILFRGRNVSMKKPRYVMERLTGGKRDIGRTALIALVVLVSARGAEGQILTFDEPQSQRSMTHICACVHTQYYSDSVSQFTTGTVTLTATGSLLYVRSTFDDRSPNPYPYRFIAGNVVQVYGNQLRIDLSQPSDHFGFGAALNATSGVGQMTVQLFEAG